MRETPTRERLVTEAMRLFGEQGYTATSVAQIEAAAGLAPGSGALYHHFKSKEALLDAGIDRQLDRRHAMRDIRAIFSGLGDLRSELTMLGRYVLAVLDEESQLLQIASRLPLDQSTRLTGAYAALFEGLYAELAGWVTGWIPTINPEGAAAIGAIAVNALHGKRTTSAVFHAPAADMADEQYIAEWTAMLASRIESLR
ncbi:putative transcriptional regulator, TetR family protein [Mycobacterium kubicae]|uniref:TetR/AcrR family transcriptional regulator n=1 Tax=Mycobacterium kubicae TaxID=120959 RepID=A0AAX1JC13_9MYCO|nr:TetR/AcrR family transcriptional regulator [Mycobacterium kubicae]MCV7094942.1 TetR/AcrR family transcriptional regulator [Mycobacterium kubicae]ORW02762.1 TetR family transcriptional regulator [Mycobacterium kubicae]QNI09850.1 TetR/AcrR family transcriptional regulator [Mycobacterium kubicae]QPI38050.1 TetR/AcrR family transcriptional regulator [Mycobacterium kubicae]GFG65609.1 putative transcriptional regulator, TetR family protein [Mycobacterium kubicae]